MKVNHHLSVVEDTEDGNNTVRDWAMRITDLSKRYNIYTHDRNRLREFFGNRKHHKEHWSIKNLSLDIFQGECLGVIGPNGAGKSTLLRILSGITAPTMGNIEIKGELSPLLDLGVGFHPSFTGRENIRLSCKLLGMNDEQITTATPQILQFAELGDFIDFPVRTYSSGMQLRLGFAIAAHVHNDILLIDEVLAVGDQRFQRKCVAKIESFLHENRTIILVSHDLHAVRSLCDRVLWIDHGEMQMLGPATEIVDRYIQGNQQYNRVLNTPKLSQTPSHPSTQALRFQATTEDPHFQRLFMSQFGERPIEFTPGECNPVDVVEGDEAIMQGTGEIDILSVDILDGEAHPRQRFQTGEDLVFGVHFRTNVPVINPIFGVALFRTDGVYIHGPNSKFDKVLDGRFHGVYTFYIRWSNIPILTGVYEASVAIFDQHHIKPHIWHNRLYRFEVAAPFDDHGIVFMEHDWGLLTHYEPPTTEAPETE